MHYTLYIHTYMYIRSYTGEINQNYLFIDRVLTYKAYTSSDQAESRTETGFAVKGNGKQDFASI